MASRSGETGSFRLGDGPFFGFFFLLQVVLGGVGTN
jgi:hypothetical protein